MSTPTDDLEAIKNALHRASARIGCPPGDNADADLYRELSHAVELVSRLSAHPPTSELMEAAQAVVERWDSPLWKHVPHTGEFINRLRRAIAAHPKEVAPSEYGSSAEILDNIITLSSATK